MKGASVALSTSQSSTATMWSLSMPAHALASRKKRSTLASSPRTSVRSTFTATRRFVTVCSASKTSAEPPVAMRCTRR
jgi:hypothetical protein